MDVQVLSPSMGFPRLPIPGRRARTPERPPSSMSSPPTGTGMDEAAAAASRQAWLYAYTAASIVAGLGALLWSTMTVPVLPAIDPGLEGTALSGPDGGMLLWIAFGLIGSLRVLPIPGGTGVWTFHLPFIAAAMVLGGPTAGAWVGFLATIERRELESQPWYGTLANHAVMAFAAVVGGLTVLVVRGALTSADTDPSVANLAAIALGTLVLATVANCVAAGTIILRDDLSPSSLLEVLVRSFGGVTLAEIGLAWVFVILYATAGWWAPLAIAVAIVLVWPGSTDGPDPLTGLMRLQAFQRALTGKLRGRLGPRGSGILLMIDLDKFGLINKDPRYGFDVGNEVLAEIGKRIRQQVRLTDLASRLGGDEFAVFLVGRFDADTALALARRFEQALRRPVLTSAGVLEVGVSIAVLIVTPRDQVPLIADLMKAGDDAMQGQKKVGGGVRLAS